jgi:uncharacterized protein YnzC (UPF0291/DUF896 family)
MNSAIEHNETAIWSRTIEPEKGSLSPAAASALLDLRMSPTDVERVNELSAKARDGHLAQEEIAELDDYLQVGRALELLKAKARLSLHRTHGSPG